MPAFRYCDTTVFMATESVSSRLGLDARRRNAVLATCCLSVFVAGIDTTIVNVALPSIQGALHASVSGLQWAIDVYTLVIACLLDAVWVAGRPVRSAPGLPARVGDVLAGLAAVQPRSLAGWLVAVPSLSGGIGARC